MNWKKLRYNSIQVGDMVKCIINPYSILPFGGAGWEDGLIFKVTRIYPTNGKPEVLWGEDKDFGVFIEWVKKVY